MLSIYVKLLRVNQWIKNLFLFLPVFFVLKLTDTHLLLLTAIGFFAFCFLSAAVYIFNDYCDQQDDRLHLLKKDRPIAAGLVKGWAIWLNFAWCLFLWIGLSLLLPLNFFLAGVAYLLINILYSLKLKHIPVLDVMILALGYWLRVKAGGFIGDIPVSMWLTLVSFLLALFIGFAKRRDDVLLFLKDGKAVRKSVQGYSLSFLNIVLTTLAVVTTVSYLMYTLSAEVINRLHSDKLYLSTFFVVIGLLRYLQLAFVKHTTGDPTEIILKDRVIQFTLLVWLVFLYAVLYVHIPE